jgi:hypothetical protein
MVQQLLLQSLANLFNARGTNTWPSESTPAAVFHCHGQPAQISAQGNVL